MHGLCWLIMHEHAGLSSQRKHCRGGVIKGKMLTLKQILGRNYSAFCTLWLPSTRLWWIWAIQNLWIFYWNCHEPQESYHLVSRREKKRMVSCFKVKLSSLLCQLCFKLLIVVIIDRIHVFFVLKDYLITAIC